MSRRIRTRELWPVYLAVDVFAIALAYYATYMMRFRSELGIWAFDRVFAVLGMQEAARLGVGLQEFYATSGVRIVLILSVILCPLYAFQNLYAGRRFIIRRPEAWNIILANSVALALFYSYFYVRRNVFHPRSIFAVIAFFNILLSVSLRRLLNWTLQHVRLGLNVNRCSALLVGSDEKTKELDEFVRTVEPHGMRITARIAPTADETDDQLAEKIATASAEHGCDMIIVGDPNMAISRTTRILAESERLGMAAKILSKQFDVLVNQGRIPTDMVHGVPLVHFGMPSKSKLLGIARNAVSTAAAGLCLVILSPLLLLIAAVVRATSAGPAIFVQERIGEERKPFRMYKFRTMQHLADDLQAQLEEFNDLGKGLFKMKKDPRATVIGRILRRLSLDELPQLANVIKGEMTIVGPRPLPVRDFTNYYEEWHFMRHSGRPGLTGLWQVSGRSDVDFQDMCILDLYYLRNRNVILDIKIILKTVWVVFFARGAY